MVGRAHERATLATWQTVVLAVALAAGAWARRPVPSTVVIGVGLGAVALTFIETRSQSRFGTRALVGLVAAGLLLASWLGARAWNGAAPVTRTPLSGPVTLLTDPRTIAGAVVAVARFDGHHVELWARGSPGRRLARVLAGERIVVTGDLGPVPARRAQRARTDHIVGQATLTSVQFKDQGSGLSRSANRIRRLMDAGARTLPAAEQSMYLGFVLGDDRDQPPDLVAAYRNTGLSHLTAVSGENVAFVLVVAQPVLGRLGARARWLAVLALIAWFALVTRAEPSVLRAAVMAGLAATARFAGRPAAGLRVLALTAIVLLLVDPFLVHSVGFVLSLGASAGIVVLAGPIAQRVPGPRVIVESLAVSCAAQLGVLPISLIVFGGVPLVSPLANLLAAPAAGPIMTWGLTGGLVAGLTPDWLTSLIQMPALALVRWITLVARVCDAIPLGNLRAGHLGPVAVLVAVLVVITRVVTRGSVFDQRRRRGAGGRGSP